MRILRKQKGMALLEIVLAVAVVAPVGAYAVYQLNQSLEASKGQQNAERTMDFTELAKNYYLANAVGMRAAMLDGTGASTLCRLAVDPLSATPQSTGIQSNSTTLHTCAVDVAVLKWKKIAPATFPDVNLSGQKMVAIFRRIYDTSVNPATPTDNVELLSVGASAATGSADYAPASRGVVGTMDPLIRDALAMGASGGVIPDADRQLCKWLDSDPNQREACGAQGGWRVKLSEFVNP